MLRGLPNTRAGRGRARLKQVEESLDQFQKERARGIKTLLISNQNRYNNYDKGNFQDRPNFSLREENIEHYLLDDETKDRFSKRHLAQPTEQFFKIGLIFPDLSLHAREDGMPRVGVRGAEEILDITREAVRKRRSRGS